jgi:hypothetical protein
LLYHVNYPFLVACHCRPCAALCGLFALTLYTLPVFIAGGVTNYFDGCYAQEREHIVEC